MEIRKLVPWKTNLKILYLDTVSVAHGKNMSATRACRQKMLETYSCKSNLPIKLQTQCKAVKKVIIEISYIILQVVKT
jgi:hypothetical protein